MGRHRERVDIIADILKASNGGSGITKIMYRANLSYTLLRKYLGLVCNCGLLNNRSSEYELTSKGKFFLKKYDLFNQKRERLAESIVVLTSERRNLEQIIKFNPIGGFS